MRILVPGNCFCWAIILKCIYGGKIFTIANEVGENARNVRHYMVRDRNGRVRHFKRIYDFLPEPYCLFFFIGALERSGRKRKKL